MGTFDGVFESLEAQARLANPMKDGDCIDEDGLLRCGICGKKLQHRLTVRSLDRTIARVDNGTAEHDYFMREFNGRVVPCACDCPMNKRIAQEKKQKEFAVAEMRKQCFARYDRLKTATFANDDGRTNVGEMLRQYADTFSRTFGGTCRSLVLGGQSGHGKTFLSACVCNYLVEKCIPCKFTSFREIKELKGKFYSLEAVLDGLFENRLIVFDDVTIDDGQDLFEVVDAMYNRGVRFIMTTNQSTASMKAFPRVFSRLKEMCDFHKVECSFGDRRLTAQVTNDKYNNIG